MQTKIPPPVWLLLFGTAMWFLAKSEYALGIDIPFAPLPAVLIAAFGISCSARALLLFRAAGTTVNPLHPEEASSLVTDGIFARTRNPMYVGLLLVLTGWAVWLQSLGNLLLLLVFIPLITYLQIRPEEAALQKLFGDAYADYCRRVPRWL